MVAVPKAARQSPTGANASANVKRENFDRAFRHAKCSAACAAANCSSMRRLIKKRACV
jgi:hypothetical protein